MDISCFFYTFCEIMVCRAEMLLRAALTEGEVHERIRPAFSLWANRLCSEGVKKLRSFAQNIDAVG
jgi:hypothetical protein